ncbi:NAD-dependent epimerase/dehydratase family protein [Brevibacillus antibioticus]|uniref:NAD-dependent epimerase/dehydratase family protein n=1 Tax=Brevibacillus antibioticus TaxID=2570228 RepID=A0A4U2Y7C6_9BACL|nr:NAD-dependent epimerase/dehydratase family protein [Brevibacillus antibioticus]TKI56516.1 NAD-dependent epimerase/dehydratase family protein [Brevibacillus antibioticus]
MKILVTGATGFLGSQLVKALRLDGHTIIILKRSTSDCSRIKEILPDLITYDTDHGQWEAPLLEQGKIDAIIHTATCYGRNNESHTTMVDANVTFPLKLLDMAMRFGTPFFLNTDTFSSAPIRLSKHLQPYNLTKRQFREWGKCLADTSSLQFINVRLEHVYGPYDNTNKFVTSVIKSCLENQPELRLTEGKQARDFIYVEDVVSAFRVLLAHAARLPAGFTEYQVGTGTATSIREFVERVHQMTQSSTVLKFGSIAYTDREIMHSQADTRSLQGLGWNHRVKLEDGLRKVMATFK